MHINEKEKSFYEKYYKALEGGEITKAGVTEDGFPFFTVQMKNGDELTCEVSQDPEGNGPGFLFGLPRPSPTS